MAILGCFSGVLIFLPIGGATLEVVPAFWMVMMGILYAGSWPNGEPPAWASGEARPWPSQAERRAEYAEQRASKQAAKGRRPCRGRRGHRAGAGSTGRRTAAREDAGASAGRAAEAGQKM
jgi:hypothetical protein